MDTTSKQEHKQHKEGSTRGVGDFRPSPDLLLKDECSEIPIDSEVPPKRPERRRRKSKSRSSTRLNQSSEHIPNFLQTPSDTNNLFVSAPLNSEVQPQRPKRRGPKSTLRVIVGKDSSNSRLSSKEIGDVNTFVPPPAPPFPGKDNGLPPSKEIGDVNTFVPPPPPPFPSKDNSLSPSKEIGDVNTFVPPPPPPFLSKDSSLPPSNRVGDNNKIQEKGLGKEAQDPRSDLLQAIRSGVKLKKVQEKCEQKPLNTKVNNDVASILARRVAVEISDSSSGSDSDSDFNNNDDGWDN